MNFSNNRTQLVAPTVMLYSHNVYPLSFKKTLLGGSSSLRLLFVQNKEQLLGNQ